MLTDKTYGYVADGIKYDKNGNDLAKHLDRVTPSSNNLVVGENPKIIALKENDPWGYDDYFDLHVGSIPWAYCTLFCFLNSQAKQLRI